MPKKKMPPPGGNGRGRWIDEFAGPSDPNEITSAQSAQSRTGAFATSAPGFWSNGYSVIPLNGGHPAVKEWMRYIDGPPPLRVRAEWLVEFGHCEIGLLLGTPLGGGTYLGAFRAYGKSSEYLVAETFPDAVTFSRRNRNGTLTSRTVFVQMLTPFGEAGPRDATGEFLAEFLGRGSFIEFEGRNA